MTIVISQPDRFPILASGTPNGKVVLWNLEKRRLQSVMAEVHDGAVACVQFLSDEPIMITTGTDNSLKVSNCFLHSFICSLLDWKF
jgi:U3 small nucleolar RNA-associated protein 21